MAGGIFLRFSMKHAFTKSDEHPTNRTDLDKNCHVYCIEQMNPADVGAGDLRPSAVQLSEPRGYSLPFYSGGGPCQYLGSEILQQNHIWGL